MGGQVLVGSRRASRQAHGYGFGSRGGAVWRRRRSGGYRRGIRLCAESLSFVTGEPAAVSAPASESRIVESILRLRSNVRRPCAARYEAANQTFYAWLNVPKMPSHDCE